MTLSKKKKDEYSPRTEGLSEHFVSSTDDVVVTLIQKTRVTQLGDTRITQAGDTRITNEAG